MKKGLILLISAVLLIVFSVPALAIEIVYTEEVPVKQGLGVEMCGFYSSYGISYTYNINDQLAVQGILGVPNIYMNFSGIKLMYRFVEGDNQNYYLFGTGGLLSGALFYGDTLATGTGWAGGFGLEYSPNYFPDFLRYSTEIGYAGSSLEDLQSFLYFNLGFRVYF